MCVQKYQHAAHPDLCVSTTNSREEGKAPPMWCAHPQSAPVDSRNAVFDGCLGACLWCTFGDHKMCLWQHQPICDSKLRAIVRGWI